MKALNLRAFCPAKDYELATAFYQDLGFEKTPLSDGLCELSLGSHSILLQDYYNKEWADNFVLLLSVEDIEKSWAHIQKSGILTKYKGVRVQPPKVEPWGTVIYLIGPSGELWQITEFN